MAPVAPKPPQFDYLDRGLSIIPLRPDGKKPFGRWRRWMHEPMTARDVRNWWGPLVPRPNVGIVGGPVSGNLVILDVEPEHVDALDGLTIPPEHPQVETARGGRHIYCYGNLGCGKLRIGERVVGDVRGVGGYVVAPPSTTESGAYRWIVRPEGWTAVDLPPLPSWVSATNAMIDYNAPLPKVGRRMTPSQILEYLPSSLKRTIHGWRNGGAFDSASELDFRVCRELVHMNADLASIERFFRAMPFGENLHNHAANYLENTYRVARAFAGNDLEDAIEISCRRVVVAAGGIAGGPKRRIYLEFDDGEGALITHGIAFELHDGTIAGEWAQICAAYDAAPVLDQGIIDDRWIPAIARGSRLLRVVRRDVLDQFAPADRTEDT